MTENLRTLALEAAAASTAQADPDYPLVHLAPPVGRLNDPNGLLVSAGTCHAFYQYTPMHGTRRLVYWGHASSTDLLHWQHHEPAVVPDSFYDVNGAYSGNAIVLEDEELAHAPAGAPYQLFYTGNVKDPRTDERTASQCLVTSPDLATFTKWPGNPLLPTHAPGYTAHFRDPQVMRDPERPGGYRMLLGVQREDSTGAALVYRSADLVSWELDGEITFPGAGGRLDALGYMWECPGLVTLTDELTQEEWDVLVFCPQGAASGAAGGYRTVFPCVYTVGHLVGTEMRDCDGTLRQVDHGFEFYAPQVFARRPSEPGPVLLSGWAGNAGQDDQPSIGTGCWVHCLTVPRALSLRGGRLVQRPAVPLGRDAVEAGAGEASSADLAVLEGHRSWHLVLDLERQAGEGGAQDVPEAEAGARLTIGDEECFVTVELVAGGAPRLVIDRGLSRYHEPEAVRVVDLDPGTTLRLEVVHDRSVTEVFVGDGDLAATFRSFVAPTATGARLVCGAGLRVAGLRAAALD
ncbi:MULTISPECIES: GH32 C-terminal domain-containing protein [unclassified Actinomyces]|uniref:glycoside hydrolase family 32 protein n=1 Tax=unclassified Actinomyces TaxID=2609248 RepID=UPI0020173146|nr:MULTISPECIES: GH32 C-terminal domain-containing protein [unclassified Actinomyces]MCL3778199.1 glycoside hydrolase family 32 protein [Actinomyces sp. AC-20-1]MCL3788902.1 glycoside hydrolase family 32 protein [Actinomyces sp. 187325]MCL3792198.1 glycoside hydrolase family 32 protein [Actinomyces sp. 186855]MCL3794175.1 glycoside hydrolase family 32 protein [Actinomyces sp. 217892]